MVVSMIQFSNKSETVGKIIEKAMAAIKKASGFKLEMPKG